MIDSVVGKISAAKAPMTKRTAISAPARCTSAPMPLSGGEAEQPDEQRRPAAEAVAERAGGQDQRGEGQVVAVDDPLQVAGASRAAGGPGRAARR